jgi:hypothetical protein
MSADGPARLLDTWLSRRLKGQAQAWLAGACARAAQGERAACERALFISFSAVGRSVGRADLAPSADELAAAGAVVPRFDPRGWSVDQAARVRLVLSLNAGDAAAWLAAIDRLFAASGLEEQVALYQGLALLPHPALLRARAAEGVRNSMRAVFAAVALDNPYPEAWLEEGAWNQLVLKCLFVDCPLSRVVGLDRRANPALTSMLLDYAHERGAAKRTINPLLWRPVGACLDDAALADLVRLLDHGDSGERQAAALALSASPRADARAALASQPALDAAVRGGQLSWDAIVPSPP